MQHLKTITEFLPAVRGILAGKDASGGMARPVLLSLADADPAAADTKLSDADPEAAAKALQEGAKSVAVDAIGTVRMRSNPDFGDAAGAGLSNHSVLVTGGAGGLGYATAEAFVAEGAAVALLDIAEQAVQEAAARLGCAGFVCDVTKADQVEQTIARIVAHFGGIDILISNAGAAHPGSLLALEDGLFEKAFALNFWSHHYVARNVVRVMQYQGTGGALVFNVSKQAVNPGPGFGAYGTPKAALMALMRQYAVEHGSDGITANAVNADRIRTGLMTEQMIAERSRARGVSAEDYMRGNLVKREVTAQDVANAFVYLAKAKTSTGAVLTVDGGNVAAMMR